MGYVLMPVKNNVEKTLEAIASFVSTYPTDEKLVVIADGDREIAARVQAFGSNVIPLPSELSRGFWNSMNWALDELSVDLDEPIVYVGNDVTFDPGWYEVALETLDSLPLGLGLVAFNDGIHYGFNASHGMTTRRWLRVLNGTPYFHREYFHYFCDTEMTNRSHDLGCYLYAPESVVLHRHDDSVKYESFGVDKILKDQRDVLWLRTDFALARRRLQDAISR